MKTDCSIVKDLLPLYIEDMVSPETAEYIARHLEECSECRGELAILNGSPELVEKEQNTDPKTDGAKPFKKIMKRMNRQFYYLSYSLIIFFIFLGFGSEEFLEVALFQFFNGLVEYLVVHVVAHLADKARLFGTEYVACAADIKVAHGNVEATADGGEFLDGAEPALGVVGEGEVGGDEHIAERLAV